MSDIPQAPDWWQASDGKWYPPQPGQAPADPFAQQQAAAGGMAPGMAPPPGVSFGAPAPPGSGRGCASIGVILSVLTLGIIGAIIAFSVFVVGEANAAVD